MAVVVGAGEASRLYAFGTDVSVNAPLGGDASSLRVLLDVMESSGDGTGLRFENAGLVTHFQLKGAVPMAF